MKPRQWIGILSLIGAISGIMFAFWDTPQLKFHDSTNFTFIFFILLAWVTFSVMTKIFMVFNIYYENMGKVSVILWIALRFYVTFFPEPAETGSFEQLPLAFQQYGPLLMLYWIGIDLFDMVHCSGLRMSKQTLRIEKSS